MSPRISVRVGVLSVFAAVVTASFALRVAAEEAVDPHAEHHLSAPPATVRSIVNYQVPPIKLVRDDGRSVSLADELNDGRPVVLNFIYTTCSGICPLASHIFSQLQHRLGADRKHVHLVSISIDPEEDTPARLRDYASRHSAGPGWQHYTGTMAASIAAQRAFDVYRGDKMGHTPVTLIRTAPGLAWVRFDGFATPDMLLQELRGPPQVTAVELRAQP